MVFSGAELVNILVSLVGGEGLRRLADPPAGGVRWMRRIAKQVVKEADPIVVDRSALEAVIADTETWKVIAREDGANADEISTLFAAAVVPAAGSDHHTACVTVAKILARKVTDALTILDAVAIQTYGNSEQTLEDLGALAAICLDLHDRLDDVTRQMDDIVRASSHDEVLGRFAGASPTDGRAVSSFAAVLLGALAIHREVADAVGHDAHDIWLIDDFSEVVLEGLVPSLLPILDGTSNPDERLLAHVVLLYIDAVLRIESSVRLGAIEQPEGASALLKVDLTRAAAVSPDLAGRRERIRSSGVSTPVLDHWLAHQAAVLSPATWEGWAARDLATAMAALVEARPNRQGETADLIRRLGRHAAFDVDLLPADRRALRSDAGPHPVLNISPQVTGSLSRLCWKAFVDPRRTGQRLVEQLGLRTEFPLEEAVSDLRAALWTVDEMRVELDGACAHPATALALGEHVADLGAELADMARTGKIASERSVSSRRLRAREVDGRPVFETPLVQLELAQDEVRRLLMGDALYGNPELAVRELYQNALDACRYRSLRTCYRQLSASEPAYEPTVSIVQDRTDDSLEIRCTDNGVGMSYVELRDAFTRAGRRFTDLPGFQDEQARWLAADSSLKLHPNSRFGIGVFSYFMLADEVIIDTVRERPDGTLDHPLHVSIPASSGLLTISSPPVPPPEIAGGGTIVTLVMPSQEADRDRVRHLSVVRTLEELVWTTEISLAAQDDRGRSRRWDPSTLKRGDGHVAFTVDGCTAWWTEGAGGVLVDGIKTDIDLVGIVVSLTGLHAPRLSVDRNTVMEWDEEWVTERLRAAAPEVFAWDGLTMAWLWRLAHHWPVVGQAIHEVAEEEDRHVRVDADDEMGGVPLRRLGLFPYDALLVRAGRALNDPLPRPPRALRMGARAAESPRIPESLVPWRLAALRAVGVQPRRGGPSAEIDPETLVVGDPFLCAAMTGGRSRRSRRDRAHIVTADPTAIVVGAARTGLSIPDLARRVRQLHACGLCGPPADLRHAPPLELDRGAVRLLAGARAFDRVSTPRPLQWFMAAVSAAGDLRRPVSSFAPVFEALQALGMTSLPDLSDCRHVPTPGEVTILCDTTAVSSLNDIVRRAARNGFRDPDEALELLAPYRRALESCGCDVADLEEVQHLEPAEDEAIAWSWDLNGSAPWIYFGTVGLEHVARVAQRLGLPLPDAYDLVSRAPGALLSRRRPVSDVRSRVMELLVAAPHLPRGENSLTLLTAADRMGVDPEDLVEAIAIVRGEPLEVYDWAAVRRFTPDHVQRHLLARGGSADRDLDTRMLTPLSLVRTAESLHMSLRDVARHAAPLGAIGIQLAYSEPVPDAVPAEADRNHAQAASLGRASFIETIDDGGTWPGADVLRKVMPWCRWAWEDDQTTDDLLAAISDLADREPPIGPRAVQVALRLEAIARTSGGLSQAHLIEVAGSHGMSSADLRDEVTPLEPLFDVRGWPIPWLPAACAEVTIDWLDVAVVGLLVARGSTTDDELRSLVRGNLDAEGHDLDTRIDRWLPLLTQDPGSAFIMTADPGEASLTSGMVRWPAASAASGPA